MNAEQIRKLADGFPDTSVLPVLLRVCADLMVASQSVQGQCDLSDWRALDYALARLEALQP